MEGSVAASECGGLCQKTVSVSKQRRALSEDVLRWSGASWVQGLGAMNLNSWAAMSGSCGDGVV